MAEHGRRRPQRFLYETRGVGPWAIVSWTNRRVAERAMKKTNGLKLFDGHVGLSVSKLFKNMTAILFINIEMCR